jgi:hypothetical protein
MARPTVAVDFGLGGSFRRTLLDHDDLVACWPLSEISSVLGGASNILGADYAGAIEGTNYNLAYPVDIPEGALGFRAVSDGYVEVAHDDALCLSGGAIDILFLVVTSTNDATNRCIVQKQDTNSAGNGWHVSMQNGAIEFYLEVAGAAIFNFQRGSIADGVPHLVHCCYEPANSRARIFIDGVQSGATVSGVSTTAGTTTADLRIGQFTDGAGQFIGVVSYMTLATSGDPTWSVDLAATMAWTDVTSHLRAHSAKSLHYGISGNGPTDRVASPGTFQFTLKNQNPSNGDLGYYSIGHANVRSGFDLGTPVRLRLTHSSTTYFKFRGTIYSVTPEAGQYNALHTDVVAVDWMHTLTETHLSGVPVQVDQAAWQCFGFVADNADNPPVSTDISGDTGTFPYCFDNSEVESMSAMTEAQRIAQSDQCHIYLKGDTTTGGVLVLESRASRQSRTVDASFDDSSLFALDIAHDLESMVNRCKVTVNPRSDGSADQVLYALGAPRLITSKENIVIEGPYTDPSQSGKRVGGQALQTLASGTDYAMFRNSDATGRDMTTSLQIVDESGANGARFLIHNADDQDGYLTLLRKRGTPLLDYDPTTSVYEDEDSIRRYRTRQVSFEMPYQTDSTVAQNAAIQTVNARSSPLSKVREMRLPQATASSLLTQALAREVGDLIQIKEQVAIGTSYVRFYIQSVSLDIGPTGIVDCAWGLAPVNAQGGFWILGTSILGTDTVLGWTD